ncbi:hypothetical protein QFZ80_002259 [Paenibacillus sp. V4I7]|nr:hypothetical protein [Paenibacillus sp. V4I7]
MVGACVVIAWLITMVSLLTCIAMDWDDRLHRQAICKAVDKVLRDRS